MTVFLVFRFIILSSLIDLPIKLIPVLMPPMLRFCLRFPHSHALQVYRDCRRLQTTDGTQAELKSGRKARSSSCSGGISMLKSTDEPYHHLALKLVE